MLGTPQSRWSKSTLYYRRKIILRDSRSNAESPPGWCLVILRVVLPVWGKGGRQRGMNFTLAFLIQEDAGELSLIEDVQESLLRLTSHLSQSQTFCYCGHEASLDHVHDQHHLGSITHFPCETGTLCLDSPLHNTDWSQTLKPMASKIAVNWLPTCKIYAVHQLAPGTKLQSELSAELRNRVSPSSCLCLTQQWRAYLDLTKLTALCQHPQPVLIALQQPNFREGEGGDEHSCPSHCLIAQQLLNN